MLFFSVQSIAINFVLLFFGGPILAFGKSTNNNTLCLDETHVMYANTSRLLEAAKNYSNFVTDICNSTESQSICKGLASSDIARSLVNGAELQASLDATATYSDPLFTTYIEVCSEAGGDLCVIDAIVNSTLNSSVPIHYTLTGIPVCYSKSCQSSDLHNASESEILFMFKNGDWPIGAPSDGSSFSEFSKEVTRVQCEASLTGLNYKTSTGEFNRPRVLRGRASPLH